MNTCVITGMGAGIGKAVALELVKRDYFDAYALLGRNEESIYKTANEMKKMSNATKIAVYKIDLEYSEQIPNVISTVNRELGSITCLLNIAGFTDPQSLFATTLESFERTYRINVFSPFMLIRECARYMKKQGEGKILNVASTAGMTPRPGWLSYASSKAAVISMSQTLTEELTEYGIKVYCVSPGRCATNLRKKLAPDEDPTSIMQPKDVAEIICSLINPKENCLDGQNIVIRKQLS